MNHTHKSIGKRPQKRDSGLWLKKKAPVRPFGHFRTEYIDPLDMLRVIGEPDMRTNKFINHWNEILSENDE